MGFAVFRIRAEGDEEAAAELNRFLAGRRILQVDRRLVEGPGGAYWSFCVECLDGGKPEGGGRDRKAAKIDYKEVLEPKQFERFTRLRTKRKELADAEGVPLFALFTNEQLAQIARMEKVTLSSLRAVDGFGEQKCKKYGTILLETLGGKMAPETTDAQSTEPPA